MDVTSPEISELPFLFFSLFMKVKGERSMHTGNHPEDGQTGMIVLPYVASSDDHHCQTKDLFDHRCLSGRQRGKRGVQYRNVLLEWFY